jgi:glycosyltransferase involved in cell wall biosynthesis
MKISACLMVKNEEKFLPQCLESIQPMVDEIIVVDTGSTDNTIQIAESFGAKVYHSPWQDNFSFHRNESISYADDGSWVLIIDADERLVKFPNCKGINDLKKWLSLVEKQYNAVALMVNDIQNKEVAMSCNSGRIFKKEYIHYENRVHNSPIFDGAAVLCDLISLEHYGYDLSKEQMMTKFHRTHKLLMRELKDVDESGLPKNKDVYFYLCQLLGHHKRHKESRKWGYKYLKLKHIIPPDRFNYTIYFTMIKSCQEAGLMEEAYKLINEAMGERPLDPDIASALADHGALTDNKYVMAEGCRRYIRGYREMVENPAKKAGQFYFSLREDLLTLNIYRLCIASLQEGMETWKYLKPRLSKTSPDVLKELYSNLNLIGQAHLLSEVKEVYGDVVGMVKNLPKLDVYQIPIGE